MLTEYFNMNILDVDARKYLYREFPQHYVWDGSSHLWTKRKKQKAIGRIRSVNPSKGDRYYLRLLLNHIHGATSFTDLLTVDEHLCSTFREAAQKRGLLENDNDNFCCLEEATTFAMPSSLRRLFATILVFCEPNNVRLLWNAMLPHMAEDLRTTPETDVNVKANYVLKEVGNLLKTAIIPGGRTAHSRFKIPIDIKMNDVCKITKQSSTTRLLTKDALIIWDEASMSKKYAIEALDRTFQDIMDSSLPFGRKVIVFGGDFRQVLPVVPRATREETIDASNGTEETISGDLVQIPTDMLIEYEDGKDNKKKLIDVIFPNLDKQMLSSDFLAERGILTTKNEYVDDLNKCIINNCKGDEVTYYSYDNATDDTNGDLYWTIKCSVLLKGKNRSYNNEKGSGSISNITLMDEKHTQIRAVLFAEAMNLFGEKLQQGQTYYISNGAVKKSDYPYSSERSIEIILNKYTTVTEATIEEQIPGGIPFIPLCDIAQYLQPNSFIGVDTPF
ncbi:uncharacterized protein LOC143862927 [Tasmannia lanceolata]|uniref:uncharacterized protein LOC143859601 n=1 Tax=Tasmannia lanceolata TaxID=3420 RepID=UPI004062B515